ncbi:DUF7285 family protein [Natrinema longum]|uniref:Uncharacterized protein n=1 Tax=Natrinema longum TaxID=370324 RepID=A0A8A2U8Q4_9EURY|nr:hypothetical protein [Natrinema longum]MBZ6493602.1 hypothetical protein [Natrinema longum]QSW85054.1 hypothetical protein J0X27_16655 [Natrinema longum]
MSRSSPSRAQTEPLAAICAVSIFAIALGLYAVAAHPILPGSSEQATADRTIDYVWDDIEEDGVFNAADSADDIDDHIAGSSLPAGSTVSVTVTVIDHGGEQRIAGTTFPSGYPDETDASDIAELERYIDEEGVPDRASVATRSIPVAVVSRADIRSGTLRVSVW